MVFGGKENFFFLGSKDLNQLIGITDFGLGYWEYSKNNSSKRKWGFLMGAGKQH
jgi:hypothetical protein